MSRPSPRLAPAARLHLPKSGNPGPSSACRRNKTRRLGRFPSRVTSDVARSRSKILVPLAKIAAIAFVWGIICRLGSSASPPDAALAIEARNSFSFCSDDVSLPEWLNSQVDRGTWLATLPFRLSTILIPGTIRSTPILLGAISADSPLIKHTRSSAKIRFTIKKTSCLWADERLRTTSR